ncbi:thiosulfate oxidation carrier protein SoxY [uncultured Ruegeria sp.]|uniref:thiosulfate oxidation carrier protein SoxY n=1 Tax=uncultured Ruegeria sp. TaxID=259304 RepID=UPI00260741FF|nr:thiosulfate oxidation carrier protein SoxY [uncultured Ruegeria sp.]
MSLNRRDALQVSLGALLCLALPVRAQDLVALPNVATLEELIASFAGNAPTADSGVSIDMEAIAEDGYRVPVTIDAPSAEEVMLIAPGNPVLPVLRVRFGVLAGAHSISTRMRLGQSQEILALARLPDRSVHRGTRATLVVVGGCA